MDIGADCENAKKNSSFEITSQLTKRHHFSPLPQKNCWNMP
jgi:hypothetical protein